MSSGARGDKRHLVEFLLLQIGSDVTVDTLIFTPMNDGKMGSHVIGDSSGNRSFGGTVAQASFTDADGLFVLASLNIDGKDEFFELDVWKVDNQPLVSWPDRGQIEEVKDAL